MFDVGALIFKIQTVGHQVFQKDMAQSDQAIKKVEGSAKAAKPALDAQGKATDELGAKSRKASEEQKKQTHATENQVQAAKTLSLALIAGGLAVTAMVGLSVAKFVEFDKAMSNTAAATMATAQEQKELGDAALKAGADTAYSAKEAAAAEEELAKAGQSVSDIVGGSLTASLSLAAAGQLQVARSAEIMATTLKQFKLPAEEAAHVSDVLAAGAGKAQGSVDDMALALSYVGPVAAGLKIGLEETAGAIAFLASEGILGEKAGTGLRGVLMSLTAPSAIASKEMKKYGIEIFDSAGNMKSLAEVSGILKERLGGLTEAERSAALGRIFGNEQITAARILYTGGAEAIEEWTDKVNDSGYAAEQAAMRQDNLAGDIEKLGGAFDTALIKTGSGANDVMRDMVQILTSLVDGYGELPTEVQSSVLIFGVLTGAILLASGAALLLTTKFTELRVQLEKNNISMGKTALIGGAVGLALAGIVTIVGILAQKQAEARAKAQGYADALEQGADAARSVAEANLQMDKSLLGLNFGNAYDNAEKLGLGLDVVTDAATGNAEALREVNEVLAIATGGGDAATEMAERLGISQLDLAQSAGTLRDQPKEEADAQERGKELREQSTKATDENAESTETAADAYLTASDNASELNGTLQDLIDTINEANGVGQDAISANLDYKDALAEVDAVIANAKAGVEGYTLSLDDTTQAGRDNMAMLVDLAQDAQAAADAQFALDGNTEAYKQSLIDSRQALIDRAIDLGYNAEQAAALADQIFKIPSSTEWELIAETQRATTQISQFVADASARTIRIGVTTYSKGVDGLEVRVGSLLAKADGGKVEFYGSGGRSEHHIAQFARAGTYRVWAEPETGGEWYIPAAPAKRARSTQVLAQAAEEFGYQLVPKGSTNLAQGSPVMSSTRASMPIEVSITGPFYSYDPSDIERRVQQGVSDALDAHGLGLEP